MFIQNDKMNLILIIDYCYKIYVMEKNNTMAVMEFCEQ